MVKVLDAAKQHTLSQIPINIPIIAPVDGAQESAAQLR